MSLVKIDDADVLGLPSGSGTEALEHREGRLAAVTTTLATMLAVCAMVTVAGGRATASLALLGLSGAALTAATGFVVASSFAVLLPGHPSWERTLEGKRRHLELGETAAAVGAAALVLGVVAQLAAG